eukprot:g27177.t1
MFRIFASLIFPLEDCSSINEKWSKSLRPEMFVKWTRELTVPLGPQLRTSRTRRSLSAREHSSSRKHSVSCKGLPAREREAIARHLQRSKSQALEAPEIVQVKAQLTEEDRQWIQEMWGFAYHQALWKSRHAWLCLGRTAMQKRSEEAYDKQKQQLFVFGSPSETSKISKVGEEAE